jgi:hypothetical protein
MTLSAGGGGPEFLCIGAQKAGTTWLHSQLKQHPHVWLPLVKELHYFDSVHLGTSNRMSRARAARKLQNLAQKPAPRAKDVAYYKAIAELPWSDALYAHIFSKGAGLVRGELTPSYCAIGEAGARHVQRLSPNGRIIYLIRDPVSRMMSSLRMAARRGQEIDESMLREPMFLNRGDYAANVPVWDRVFGGNVLYVPFGDIRTSPQDTLRQIEAFIGIGHFDGYEGSEEPVHVGQKLEMSDHVTEAVRRIAAPQYEYLAQRFGEEFLRRTM